MHARNQFLRSALLCAALSAAAGADDGPAWARLEADLADRTPSLRFDALASRLTSVLTNRVEGQFSLYLEDLATRNALGIDPDRRYRAWSLLKVPVMLTVLKKVEQGEVSLEQEVVLRERDLDTVNFVSTGTRPGDRVPVRELLDRLIRLSDNTASFALSRLFNATEFQRCLLATGLPPAPPGRPRNELPDVSPRQFGNLLRSLYYPSYLEPAFCRLALALLSETVYASQIRAGLPDGVRLAHKVGFNAHQREFHDCGIVFLPGRPYILCIMSTGSSRAESDRVIRDLSRAVDEFMSDQPPVPACTQHGP